MLQYIEKTLSIFELSYFSTEGTYGWLFLMDLSSSPVDITVSANFCGVIAFQKTSLAIEGYLLYTWEMCAKEEKW